VQAAGKAEGYAKRGVAVDKEIPERIVIDLLDESARDIGHDPERTDLIVTEVVSHPLLGHGDRQAAVGVLEAHQQVVVAVIDGEQAGQPLPEVFLDDNVVDLFGNPAPPWIVQVLDESPVGQGHAKQFTARRVVVGGEVCADGFAGEKPIETISMFKRAQPGLQLCSLLFHRSRMFGQQPVETRPMSSFFTRSRFFIERRLLMGDSLICFGSPWELSISLQKSILDLSI